MSTISAAIDDSTDGRKCAEAITKTTAMPARTSDNIANLKF